MDFLHDSIFRSLDGVSRSHQPNFAFKVLSSGGRDVDLAARRVLHVLDRFAPYKKGSMAADVM